MNVTVGIADILLASPLLALFIFSLIPLTIKTLRGGKEINPVVTLLIALMGLLVTVGLLFIFGDSNKMAFNGQLFFDGLTKWSATTAIMAAAGSFVLMHGNLSTRSKQFSELMFLALNSVLGMVILVSAVNLLVMFIGLELMSLALYLMIAMSNEQKLSKEAAMKYFVLGSFASAIFLYGISFIYGSTGTVHVTDFMQNAATLIKTNNLFLFGTAFTILGFCFKVSIVPFHAWTPDVYQGSPTPVTAFMATAVKAVSFAAFLRIIATQSLLGSQSLFDVLQWLAVITMTVGNVAALIQNNLKRTLAYSAVAHSGYLLVGLIAAGIRQTPAYAASSVMFYLFSYAIMSVGAFGVVSLLEKSENENLNIDDLAGLAKNNPMIALSMTIFLLSMAGLPPAVGFFGKFYLFSAAVNEGLVWLALWGVINSVISVYFYLRPIVVMYMKEGDCSVIDKHKAGTVVLTISFAILILVLGLVSGPLFNVIEKSFNKALIDFL